MIEEVQHMTVVCILDLRLASWLSFWYEKFKRRYFLFENNKVLFTHVKYVSAQVERGKHLPSKLMSSPEGKETLVERVNTCDLVS